jgi:hypothetical protein
MGKNLKALRKSVLYSSPPMNGEKAKGFKLLRAAVTSLERKRKSKIFCLIHNAPPYHICQPDFWTLVGNRDRFRDIQTLEILVHSPGGHADVAYRLAKFFRSHCERLHMLVPIYAQSAATLLCLNADKIIMGEFAHLGPIDVQISDELEHGKDQFSPLDEFKSLEFLREYATEFLDYFSSVLADRGMSVKQALHDSIPGVAEIMRPLYTHVDPSKLGSYRRALAEGEEYAKRLLGSVEREDGDDIAQQLVWKYPAHDFVIERDEARELGLPVEKMDSQQEKTLVKLLIELMSNEISYCGFVPTPTATAKPKASPKRKRGPTRVPAPAAQRPKVAVAS